MGGHGRLAVDGQDGLDEVPRRPEHAEVVAKDGHVEVHAPLVGRGAARETGERFREVGDSHETRIAALDHLMQIDGALVRSERFEGGRADVGDAQFGADPELRDRAARVGELAKAVVRILQLDGGVAQVQDPVGLGWSKAKRRESEDRS
jgi:hypothetical protein